MYGYAQTLTENIWGMNANSCTLPNSDMLCWATFIRLLHICLPLRQTNISYGVYEASTVTPEPTDSIPGLNPDTSSSNAIS